MLIFLNMNLSEQRNASLNFDSNDVNLFYDINHRLKSMMTDPHDMIVILIGLICILLNSLVLTALLKSCNHLITHHRLIISLAISPTGEMSSGTSASAK